MVVSKCWWSQYWRKSLNLTLVHFDLHETLLNGLGRLINKCLLCIWFSLRVHKVIQCSEAATAGFYRKSCSQNFAIFTGKRVENLFFVKCFPMNIATFKKKPIYSEEQVQMAASECFHFRWLLNDVNLFFLWGSF